MLRHALNNYLRASAIGVLGSVRVDDSAVLDALSAALTDPTPEIRKAAGEALSKLGPAAKPALKPLVAALKDEHINTAVAEALARMAEVALPDVAAAAREEPTARHAAFALILMGETGVPAIKKALANPNPKVRAACMWALDDAAESLLPFFPDLSENRNHALRILGRDLPAILLKALKDEDVELRRTAAWLLARFSRDGAATLPALREAMRDTDPRVRRPALLAICSSSIPVGKRLEILFVALEDADPEVRSQAVGLAPWSRMPSPPVPALVKLLQDKDSSIRHKVILALGRIGPDAKSAVPALTKALEDPDPEFRSIAADALGHIGPGAREAVGSLQVNLADEKEEVRIASARALWFIQGEKSGAVPFLVATLSAPVRKGQGITATVAAAEALGDIGPGAKEAVPALVKALQRNDFVRGEAARALGRIGPDAETAIPALSEMLADVDVEDCSIAIYSLRHIGVAAVPVLTDALQSPRWDIRRGACDALGRIGPPAKKAVPALTEALYDPNGLVRRSAAEALRAFGPDAKTAVSPLAETLQDHYGDAAWEAAETLQCLGPSAKPAVPALAAVLRTEPKKPRLLDRRLNRIGPKGRELAFIAIETLGHLGPDAAEAVPELRAACTDADGWFHVVAAVALWRVEGKKEAALPVLKAALKDKNPRARIAAAQGLWDVDRNKDGFSVLLAELQSEVVHDRAEATKALWHIGPDARELVPNLLKLLEDKYAHYYDEAAEALKKIDPEAAMKAGVR